MIDLQNVDYLNCTKTVLYSFKKKGGGDNARSLPEFYACPSDIKFAYIKKKKNFFFFFLCVCVQISNTAELRTFIFLLSMHLIHQTYP